MRWFQALLPKEEKFVDFFVSHADVVVLGAGALRMLLEGGTDVPKHCAEIMAHEESADAIARETTLAVRRTFITPFDRSDIKALSSSLDDAIDQMKKTTKAINLFEVREFEPDMRAMADLIVESAALTREAMGLMDKLGKNSARLIELCHQITKLEDQSDEYYDRGLKALYLKVRDGNAMDYIVGAEIYDHLEKVADRFEDVADRVSGILIENL